MTPRPAALLPLAMLVLTACGGGDVAVAPADPPAATSTPASADDGRSTEQATGSADVGEEVLGLPLEDRLIAYEARRLCEVPSRTFPTLEAITDFEDELLATFNLTRDAYTPWRAQLTDADRDAVSDAYDALCGEV